MKVLAAFSSTTLSCMAAIAAPPPKSKLVVQCVQHAEAAQELRAQDKLADARKALKFCSQESCPEIVRQDCSGWLREVGTGTPAITLEPVDAFGNPIDIEIFVLVDGESATGSGSGGSLSITPGSHELRVEAEGRVPAEQTIYVDEDTPNQTIRVLLREATVDDSTHSQLSSEFASDSAASGSEASNWPFVAAGVAVVSFGSFAYFGSSGTKDAEELRARCNDGMRCSEVDLDPIQAKLTVADVSLGIGLGALGLAVWGWLYQTDASDERDSQSATPLSDTSYLPRAQLTAHTVSAQWQF